MTREGARLPPRQRAVVCLFATKGSEAGTSKQVTMGVEGWAAGKTEGKRPAGDLCDGKVGI